MVNDFANHEYCKLSSLYRLPRLFNPSGSSRGKQGNSFCSLITVVKGYGAYKLPPFRRHKENSFQRGPERGVPILYLIQNRGREIDERSIWYEELPFMGITIS